MMDKGRLNDLVLCHLLAMGAWDWDQKDGGELHQATRAMKHVTVMTSHLLPRILEGETKVSTASSSKTLLMLSLLRIPSWRPGLISITKRLLSWG